MYFLYSILLAVGFLLMLPLFILRREKYASGFRQRLGNYPTFVHDGRPLIWLHCVSIGETNAAKPLFDKLKADYPGHRLIVSTITKTGQELAHQVFADTADAIFYFPFDWKFSVRKALDNYKPSVVLLMETEIWPRFIFEAKRAGTLVALVNGRLSERSSRRYSLIGPVFRNVLGLIDLALMQTERDAERLISLGCDRGRTRVTGNLKFDLEFSDADAAIREELGRRFGFVNDEADGTVIRPLIVAASTHEPEERLVLSAYCSTAEGSGRNKPRLIIAPRHPERFDAVERMARGFRSDPTCEWPRYSIATRSGEPSPDDSKADVVILDSIGELRGVFPLADIVFVGGSLIPHGGQSILEPAAAGKAIVTGFHTFNFDDAVRTFSGNNAIFCLPDRSGEQMVDELFDVFSDLIEHEDSRITLGRNAFAVMKANRGATLRTIEELAPIIRRSSEMPRIRQ